MERLGLAFLLAALLSCNLIEAKATSPAAFLPLGDFPGGDYYSEAWDVSSDGTTVVGSSVGSSGAEAYRWTESSGLVGLGIELSVRGTVAWTISGDRSVIAGHIFDAYPNRSVFVWTADAGMVRLQDTDLDNVAGLSYDGSILVGRMRSSPGVYHAYRWSEEAGATDLGSLPNTLRVAHSHANDVSRDGSIVVGSSQADAGQFRAFRWTASDGMVGLPRLLPNGYSEAYAVSDDGSVVAGMSEVASRGTEAVLWEVGGDTIVLGDLPGGARGSSARAISADGGVVFGSGNSDRGPEAFRWTEKSGMRSVQSILAALGVEMPGWRLEGVQAVSSDGSVIVGRAVNPSGRAEAYLARIPSSYIPEPSTTTLSLAALIGLAWRRTRSSENSFGTRLTLEGLHFVSAS